MASKLTRAVQYFRTADLDEATVAFELVNKVMAGRINMEKPKQKRRGRRPKVNSQPAPESFHEEADFEG